MARVREVALLWIPAALAGFAKAEEWAEWADRYIRSWDSPEEWILDMSIAGDSGALAHALLGQGLGAPFNRADALLGYVWLRHEVRLESLETILGIAGEFADAYEGPIACEDIFGALEALRASEDTNTRSVLAARIRLLFAECSEIAAEQWRLLHPSNAGSMSP